MNIVVVADTHTRGASRPLPEGARPYIETADHILHAGDVCDPALILELRAFAPVTVVRGNADAADLRDAGAVEEASFELGGVTFGMVHDAGPRRGRRQRLRARFPRARVVVFGHSHLPCNSDAEGLLLFNPGSPTWPRRAPFASMGILWVQDRSVEGEIFAV
jgi:putative phosphoesterase